MRKILILPFFLAACGESDPARYLIDRPQPDTQVRLEVSTVELRDVVMPGHASGTDVLVQTETGALVPVGDAIWADDPVRAVTAQLAETMDVGTSATVAAEPWPLFDRSQAQVEVRLSRMIARNDGMFELAGQVAIASADRVVRERIERFFIEVPLGGATADAISTASGVALNQLATQILGYLR